MAGKLEQIFRAFLKLLLTVTAVFVLCSLFRPVCMENGECNYLLLAILIGFPFGIGRMVLLLPPASYGISGGIGVLALDLIVGGLIGCAALVFTFVSEAVHLIRAIVR